MILRFITSRKVFGYGCFEYLLEEIPMAVFERENMLVIGEIFDKSLFIKTFLIRNNSSNKT